MVDSILYSKLPDLLPVKDGCLVKDECLDGWMDALDVMFIVVYVYIIIINM